MRPRQTAGRTTECRPPRTRPQRERNFSGPFYDSHFVIVSVVAVNEPKNASFRSFHGVFAQRCRILRRVASVPQKSSRYRRESFFFPRQPTGPQGERSKKVRGGLLGPLQEVQKWHFSRVIGAQKRAPHRRKTHPRKRCAKNGPKCVVYMEE